MAIKEPYSRPTVTTTWLDGFVAQSEKHAMTIEELIQKRRELENEIACLVNTFAKETGLQVASIDLQHHATMSGDTTYTTAVRVDLNSVGL